MPGTVIGKTMNYGYPGQISRHGDEVSRTRPVKVETADVKFGAPVVQNSDGSVQLFGASNVAADFAGVKDIRHKDLCEAIVFRSLENKYWNAAPEAARAAYSA